MDDVTLRELEKTVRTCISDVENKMDGANLPARRLQRVLALLWCAYDEIDLLAHRPIQAVRQP